jgi:restriction system protein
MATWLIRAGKHGEYEQKFLQENRVYVTWDKLDEDLKAELPLKRIWTVATQEEE